MSSETSTLEWIKVFWDLKLIKLWRERKRKAALESFVELRFANEHLFRMRKATKSWGLGDSGLYLR